MSAIDKPEATCELPPRPVIATTCLRTLRASSKLFKATAEVSFETYEAYCL